MMCSAAMSQPTDWMAINTKLGLVKELYNADLISPSQYKLELEKLAEEVGIQTKLSIEHDMNKIYMKALEKKYNSKEDLLMDIML